MEKLDYPKNLGRKISLHLKSPFKKWWSKGSVMEFFKFLDFAANDTNCPKYEMTVIEKSLKNFVVMEKMFGNFLLFFLGSFSFFDRNSFKLLICLVMSWDQQHAQVDLNLQPLLSSLTWQVVLEYSFLNSKRCYFRI